MIRVWLSREQTIPMRQQLSAQLLLGIISRRLAPGEKLPSVRELARRLQIHSNTVSAAYQDLAARGWVAMRKGSGVYVRDVGQTIQSEGIDGFVRAWVEAALAQGYSKESLQATLALILTEPPVKKLLVVDPDPNLARIVATEIAEHLGDSVAHSGFSEAAHTLTPESCVLVLPTHAHRLIQQLKPDSHKTVALRSMEDMLEGRRRPAETSLIAVVSRSEGLLRWSSTLLSALGFAPDSLLLRNPDRPQWKRGLSSCQVVAADVEAFEELPANINGTVLRIVAPDFLAELKTRTS